MAEGEGSKDTLPLFAGGAAPSESVSIRYLESLGDGGGGALNGGKERAKRLTVFSCHLTGAFLCTPYESGTELSAESSDTDSSIVR